MKNINLVYLSLVIFTTCSAFADGPLERNEVLQIFQTLTSNPQQTWVQAGTITANHQEYQAAKTTDVNEIRRQTKEAISEYRNNTYKRELTDDEQLMALDAIPFNTRYKLTNEYTMNSVALVKYDGTRFYWEINVTSRQDSVKPDKKLAGNYMAKQFDLNWNQKRIFVWDGEKYTTYFLPCNQAMVDSTGTTPHNVNGPLTAGFIPWGFGYYTYANLSASESSAVETSVGGQSQINLTTIRPDGLRDLFILDPQKDYAVLSHLIYKENYLVSSRQYSNFQRISSKWVPFSILIEHFEQTTSRLLSRDVWDITSVDVNAPQGYEFAINYQADALIEHSVFSKIEPEVYRYSPNADINLLLADRMEFVSKQGTLPQNCATAALKYTASRLGKNLTDQQLSQLVNEDGRTSLDAIKQLAQSQGLYCQAVRTNLETLRSLNCRAILYLPGKEHFVALEYIDDKYVWLVDLSGHNFYYHTDINFFDMDWADGTAILLSNSPIGGDLQEINSADLLTITGLGYQCTKLLQGYDVIYCSQIGGLCGGLYTEFPTRYGCESGEGSCSTSVKTKYMETPCLIDPYYPDECAIYCDWTTYYMRACL
jgi:hypothetical protein